MKRLPIRCYFVVYGAVYAFKLSDAYEAAKEASQSGAFNLEKTGKLLKKKSSIELLQKPLTFLVLDLSRLEWKEIADQIFNITKEKASL